MPYFYEPAPRGRLCIIRFTAPHYRGNGEVVARDIELELAKRIVLLLNSDAALDAAEKEQDRK